MTHALLRTVRSFSRSSFVVLYAVCCLLRCQSHLIASLLGGGATASNLDAALRSKLSAAGYSESDVSKVIQASKWLGLLSSSEAVTASGVAPRHADGSGR